MYALMPNIELTIVNVSIFRPTELDAVVFGHLYTILTTSLPVSRFAEVIRDYKNLTDFCQRIDQKYFKDRQNDY